MGAGASSPSKADAKRGGQYRVPESDWFYAEQDTRIARARLSGFTPCMLMGLCQTMCWCGARG